ncbi:MAG: ABC transporter ATP-binding protein [Limnochordales bacterium]|nr:ABC transporter ATP-binding protein [Limnochordales bacterium]
MSVTRTIKPARTGRRLGLRPKRQAPVTEPDRAVARTATGFPIPDPLPEALAERLRVLGADGELLLGAPFDLGPDQRFGTGWVLASRRYLWIIREGELVREIDLTRARDFQAEGLVGAGELIATVDGEPVRLAAYTARYLAQFVRLAHYLNKLATGTIPARIEPAPPRSCPRCGRVLPEGVSLCAFCADKWSILHRLVEVARPHLPLFFVGVATFWVLTGLRLVQPQLYRILIDDVLRVGFPGTPTGGSRATGELIRQLLIYVGLIGLSNLLIQAVGIVRSRTMNVMGTRFARDLREMVYSKIQTLSLGYLNRQKTGDLMNRVTGDTGTIQQFLQNQAAMLFNESLVFIGVLIILFATDWRLALLVLLPAPLVAYWSGRVWHQIHHMYHVQWRAWDKTNSLLHNILSGIRVVKAFGQEEREAKRFTQQAAVMRDITANNEKAWNTLFPSLGFLISAGQFLILYFGGHLVLQRELQLGELVQFTSYAGMIYGPMQFASFVPRWFTEAMTAAERIFQVLDQEPAVKEAARPIHRRIEGAVEFRGVSFGYEAHNPVLHDINLKVEPGEMIGLVGHSGAGKSTLINLLCRFYDPDEGEILIDGINLKDYAQASLRSQIGVVLQESFLFSGTILENIAYARPDASLAEIIRAAKIANAHDFIVRFPNGYDTRVGERGQLLSVGERQRIAIARAVLRDPRILILDEATASVDSETEMQIQEALARLVKNRTTFVIAHRLSTLRNASRVVVLDKGRIAEVGTHEELIRQRGIYYKLVMAQLELSRTKGY